MGFFDRMHEPPVPCGEVYPLFTRVSIETTTWCNRRCGFCPHGKRQRPVASMQRALYTSLCQQLGNLRFNGVVQLFLLNEPLLDPLFLERAVEMRSHAPRATLLVATNGDPLDDRLTLDELRAAGVNSVVFSCYDDAGWERARRLSADCRDTEHPWSRQPLRDLTASAIDMRPGREPPPLTAKLCNRVGAPMVAPQRHCARPHRHIVVRCDGVVPICCAVDPTADLPMHGDASAQSLLTIWNGESMFRYRYHLQDRRRDLPGCDRCDHVMAYPHVVRRVGGPE